MKPSEIKQEYQLQQWAGMVRARQESGLTFHRCPEARDLLILPYMNGFRPAEQLLGQIDVLPFKQSKVHMVIQRTGT